MSYEMKEAKERVIRAGKELVEAGLIARTWGNISARISDTQFVITPSGRAYDTLTPDQIVTVGIQDLAWSGDVKPSSEKGVHAAAYALRPDVNFVIHTHQNYATALSTLARPLAVGQIEEEAGDVLGPEVPVAAYGLSSTKTLTDHVRDCIRRYPASRAVLLRNHGTLCMGRDDGDAFHVAHVLEQVSKKRYLELACGKAPEDTEPDYELRKHWRVFWLEIHEEYDAFCEIFDNPSVSCVITSDAPYIRQYSALGRELQPYVDDLTQIVGVHIPCLPYDAGRKKLKAALRETCSAVLVKGRGAVCCAGSEEDAEAVMMLVDKVCQVALLERAGCRPRTVPLAGGLLEHVVYVKKYSKLKN